MAIATKIKREMQRLEIEVPPQGNAFVGGTAPLTNGNGSGTSSLQMRILEGHSFLSGMQDTLFFDGELTLEVQFFNRGYPEKLTQEKFFELAEEFYKLYPNRYITPNLARHTFTLNLITSTETPIDVSARVLLGELADWFGLDKNALLKQSYWCLVAR